MLFLRVFEASFCLYNKQQHEETKNQANGKWKSNDLNLNNDLNKVIVVFVILRTLILSFILLESE
jgi:hypothetical protein